MLLGHTRDDQAETVLLALVRGAGPRGLAAMPVQREVDGVALVRPLLDVSRAQTAAACAALGLRPWHDPHNLDPSFARVRARGLLADLSAALGPAVVANLARTASLVAADNDVLDALAADALAAAAARPPAGGLGVAVLAGLAPAVRTRVLRAWALIVGRARVGPVAPARRRAGRARDGLAGPGSGRSAGRHPGVPPRRRPPTRPAQAPITDLAGW